MTNLFAIFHESKESFEGQEPGEEVLLILRRHSFVIIVPLVFIFLISLMPVVAWTLLFGEIIQRSWETLFFFFSTLWFLISWLLAFYILTIYSLNTVIITKKRIIENEQHGFFRRKVSELHMFRIQDVSVRTQGLFETLLSFGNISVQTAAAEKEFIFCQIPHPEKVKDAIMQGVFAHRKDLGIA